MIPQQGQIRDNNMTNMQNINVAWSHSYMGHDLKPWVTINDY